MHKIACLQNPPSSVLASWEMWKTTLFQLLPIKGIQTKVTNNVELQAHDAKDKEWLHLYIQFFD